MQVIRIDPNATHLDMGQAFLILGQANYIVTQFIWVKFVELAFTTPISKTSYHSDRSMRAGLFSY